MEFPIKFDTVKSGWSIVYFKGSQVIISKNIFLSLKIDFVLGYSADPEEMPHHAVWHFIWFFTVCQSTSLGIPGTQGVKSRSEL